MNGTAIVHISGVVLLALLVAGIAGPTVTIVRGITGAEARRWTRVDRLAFILVGLCLAGGLLRPHEHTFQGLDTSAYRLMAKAFAEGHALRQTDEALAEVPEDLRPLFLHQHTPYRLTRDRSFQVESVATCVTKPFFYPTLPLAMIGLDALAPGSPRDWLPPLVGLALALAAVAVGTGMAGWAGAFVVAALLIGSPLPAWLLRGAFAEAVGAVLVALCALSWLVHRPTQPPLSGLHFLALGLAVSFHPVMIALAVPVLGLLLVSTASVRRTLARVVLFIAGLAPLILMTEFVTAPYGKLDGRTLSHVARLSPAIQFTVVAALGFSVLFVAIFLARRRLQGIVATIADRGHPYTAALWLAAWAVPVWLAASHGQHRHTVVRGWQELLAGLRAPMIAALAVLGLVLLLDRRHGRGRLLVALVAVTLPLFLYLKGWDQVGLWSQRRLFPPLLLLLVAGVPALAGLLAWTEDKGAAAMATRLSLVVAALAAGAANAVRWPAPYTVRYERGSDAGVADVVSRLDGRLTVVDYFPYSVPLAMAPGARVLGLGEAADDRLDAVAAWVGERAAVEPVNWITAYANPGLEDGVALRSTHRETMTLDRIRSKGTLPAVRRDKIVEMHILRAEPLRLDTLPAMDKVFDRGPLGLRPPWGRHDIGLKGPDGDRLPAAWSREGSGIVGPVPAPGGGARIRVVAAANRRDEGDGQTLVVTPPWAGEPVSLTIGNDYTEAETVVRRPESSAATHRLTGVYRIHAGRPYTPETVGIRGFADDLGALIHRIRIEIEPPVAAARR